MTNCAWKWASITWCEFHLHATTCQRGRGSGKGVKKKADASAIAMFGQRSAPNGTHCLSPSQWRQQLHLLRSPTVVYRISFMYCTNRKLYGKANTKWINLNESNHLCEQNEANEVIHAYYTSSLKLATHPTVFGFTNENILYNTSVHIYIYIYYKLYAFPLITF